VRHYSVATIAQSIETTAPVVDLLALANDTTGAWETQVFRGTVVSVADAGTFVDFGAPKDGLIRKKRAKDGKLPKKHTYKGIDRKTGKTVDIEFRVGAQLHVMISSIKLADKLRKVQVGLRVAPQCRCCRGFGHVQKYCTELGAFGQRKKGAAKPKPAAVCETKCSAKPKSKSLDENSNRLFVAVAGDLSKLTVEAVPAATVTESVARPLLPCLFAVSKPGAAKPVVLDFAKAIQKDKSGHVQAKEQMNEQPWSTKASKAARRRQRAKKVRARTATLVSAPPAEEVTQSFPQQGSKPSSVESCFDTMVLELDLVLGL
jgi:hypothetical protein